jgi:hypothetical protein
MNLGFSRSKAGNGRMDDWEYSSKRGFERRAVVVTGNNKLDKDTALPKVRQMVLSGIPQFCRNG